MHASLSKPKSTLTVWAVTDNKPGHQNQVEGLIEALSNYRKVDIQWIPAISFVKNIWMLLTKRFTNFSEKSPDLILGAGHRTHLSLIALRRCCGGRIILMMSPTLPFACFDLCFIPRHDNPPERTNIVETLGAINRMKPSQIRLSNTGLILLGGPSRHYRWKSETVIRQVQSVIEKNLDVKWEIAGSRRTPEECYKVLRLHYPENMIILPEQVPRDWLPIKMQKTEQIWITADSISMVYESLTSGALTGVLQLEYEKSSRVTKEIERLIAENRVQTLEPKSIVPDKVINTPVYEADRCAKILLQKMEL